MKIYGVYHLPCITLKDPRINRRDNSFTSTDKSVAFNNINYYNFLYFFVRGFTPEQTGGWRRPRRIFKSVICENHNKSNGYKFISPGKNPAHRLLYTVEQLFFSAVFIQSKNLRPQTTEELLRVKDHTQISRTPHRAAQGKSDLRRHIPGVSGSGSAAGSPPIAEVQDDSHSHS